MIRIFRTAFRIALSDNQKSKTCTEAESKYQKSKIGGAFGDRCHAPGAWRNC